MVRSFLNAGPINEGAATLALDGLVLYCNKRFAELLHTPLQKLIGSSLRNFLPPAEHSAFQALLQKGTERATTAEINFARQGKSVPLYLSVSPLSDRDFRALCVVATDLTERRLAEEALRQSEERMTAFFAASPIGLAILDAELRYVKMNKPLALMSGLPVGEHRGKMIHELSPELAPQTEPLIKHVLATGESVLDKEISSQMTSGAGNMHHWLVSYFPVRGSSGNVNQVGAVVMDITERKRTEAELHDLSARLLQLQDEERRRIARELHDSLGQYLAALGMALDVLNGSAPALGATASKALAESLDLLQRCIAETRTLSYLLHPPLLDEMGLASGMRWYLDGFSRRSGIQVKFEVSPRIDRFPADAELCLFRVMQESLTNIHRHSGSKTADVQVSLDSDRVTLVVSDHGHGMSLPDSQKMSVTGGTMIGVGLRGMRERVNQLGGQLEITTSKRGTTVKAILPLSEGVLVLKARA